MGLKWWLIFVAQCLLKLIILVVWFLAIFQLSDVYPAPVLVVCLLHMADTALWFQASKEERDKRPSFFSWFPIGDGFYMAWKKRKRCESKWTI